MRPDLSLRGPVVPSLYTADMAATQRFYVEQLGFGRTGEWVEDGGLKWMELKHPALVTSPAKDGGSAAPLTFWFFANNLTGQNRAVCSGLIYCLIADVDGYAGGLSDQVTISWRPEDMAYGLRELGLRDNNGYTLVFAQEQA